MRHTLLTLAGLMICAGGLSAEEKKDEQKKPKAKPKAGAVRKARAIRFQVRPGVIRIGTRAYYGPAKLFLLRRPDVAKELKLEDDQKEELNEAIQEINKSRQAEYKKVRQLAGADRFKKMQAIAKKYNDMGNEKAKEILNEKQLVRLDQIAVQLQGLRALRNPEIVKKLKITKEQTQKFKQVQTDSLKERRQISQDFRNGNLTRAKYQEKLKAMNKTFEKNTLEVLDKDQQAAFKKMKGKEFKMNRRAFGVRAAPAIRINGKRAKIKKIRVKGKAIRPKKAKENEKKEEKGEK